MKVLRSLLSLFLIHQPFFYLVTGKIVNEKMKETDCTKLYNFLNGDSEDYVNSCCSNDDIDLKCDNEGYVTNIYM